MNDVHCTHTSVEHVHFHPILLFPVNHFDIHSVHHVQYDHCDVAADHVHYDLVHPIPLNRFDYDDNGLALADLTDNIPVRGEKVKKRYYRIRSNAEVVTAFALNHLNIPSSSVLTCSAQYACVHDMQWYFEFHLSQAIAAI